jgi:DnaK suppressor protein
MQLTMAQRSHLERRLRAEREGLLRDLNHGLAALNDEDARNRAGDLTSVPLHNADRGTDSIDIDVALSNATRESRELAKIDAALERLYHTPERFGVCEDTGEAIPFARLERIPWARTCDEANS